MFFRVHGLLCEYLATTQSRAPQKIPRATTRYFMKAMLALYQRLSNVEAPTNTAQRRPWKALLSQAAEAYSRVRAELLGRLGALAKLYAGAAAESRITGQACERSFDSFFLGGGVPKTGERAA